MMKRLFLLLTALLLCAAPALAEQPPMDEALLGEWIYVLDLNQQQLYSPDERISYTITENGQLILTSDPTQSMSLIYDEAAGQWALANPEDPTQTAPIFIDDYGRLIFEMPAGRSVFLRPDATASELPPYAQHLATAGTWTLTGLLTYPYEEAGRPSVLLDAASIGLPPLTMTLPAFADSNRIDQAYAEAVKQQASDTALANMGQFGGWLINADTLMVSTRGCRLMFTRTALPDIDPTVAALSAEMAENWRLVELKVGGISFPMQYETSTLTIDEHGNARLNSSTTTLQMKGDALCLGEYALVLREDGLWLELGDGTQAHFITENEWYRSQFNGTWALYEIDIDAFGLDYSTEDLLALNVRLTITDSDEVTLSQDGKETQLQLIQSEDARLLLDSSDTPVYTLFFEEEGCLTLSSPTGGSYELYFVPEADLPAILAEDD